jgi:hypothetical protein
MNLTAAMNITLVYSPPSDRTVVVTYTRDGAPNDTDISPRMVEISYTYANGSIVVEVVTTEQSTVKKLGGGSSGLSTDIIIAIAFGACPCGTFLIVAIVSIVAHYHFRNKKRREEAAAAAAAASTQHGGVQHEQAEVEEVQPRQHDASQPEGQESAHPLLSESFVPAAEVLCFF